MYDYAYIHIRDYAITYNIFYNHLINTRIRTTSKGMETTATAVRWALLLMALNPEIQQQVREEILEKIGDRPPKLSDRQSMHYSEAVLLEVHRFASISSPGLPHRSVAACKIRGFDIPENSIVLTNLYVVHHDPSIWPAPDRFDPEANFIRRDKQGAIKLVNLEYFIPFGLGKRTCIGESLAKQELWIYFVGILQKFTIAAHPNHPLPSPHELLNGGVIRAPKLFKLSFVN